MMRPGRFERRFAMVVFVIVGSVVGVVQLLWRETRAHPFLMGSLFALWVGALAIVTAQACGAV